MDYQWEEGFQHLQAFAKEQGHYEVPNRYVCADGYRLGVWVQNLRGRPERISAEQKTRLDGLGFIWEVDFLDALWESRFAELKHYKERFGDCNVPINWNENP